MSDQKNDGRLAKRPSPRANPFVRRLIPTVTAATLTFSACGPKTGGDNNNDGTNNDGTNNGNNVTQNNTASNNTTPNNTASNNTTPNNTTPNNTSNNTTPNNTNANNANTNNMNNTNGTFVFDVVDGDGTLSTEELRGFCQAWNDCDPDAFQGLYDTVDDCTQQQQTDVEGNVQAYEDEYGADCGAAYEAYLECYAGAWACIGGSAGPEAAAEEQCYETFDPDIEMHCQ